MPEAAAGSDARDLEHLLTLNLTEGIGVALFRRLLRHFGSIGGAATASEKALRQVRGIGPALAGAIRREARAGRAPRELEAASRLGVRIIPFWDSGYPAALKPLYDPPLLLYLRGDLRPEDGRALGVVGTRTPTYYGRTQAERLTRELCARGFTIVSGLARGIDTVVHGAALAARGRTIAVIGSGVRAVYPPENARLAARIAEHGGVLSEFALAASPNPKNFPRRNRIISGLSAGVLVVEAGERSGALITADWALEQGKEVFAVPGRVDSPQSAGCHRLLKQGAARLVENVEDVLEELPAWLAGATDGTGEPEDKGGPEEKGTGASGGDAAVDGVRSPGSAPRDPPRSPPVRGDEGRVLAQLSGEPRHIDAIGAAASLPSAAVSGVLLGLELKRLVRQLPGKYFVRV